MSLHIKGQRFLLGVITLLIVGLLPACETFDPNPGPDPFNERDVRFDPVQEPEIPVDTIPPTPARGAELFAQFCASCHGNDGSGGQVFGGSIQGKKGLHLIIREGRGAMPAFPTMTDNQILSLEQFLDSLLPDLTAKTGEELFKFYCAGCHGADALGTNRFRGSIRGFSPIAPIVVKGSGKMPKIDITTEKIALIQEYLGKQSDDLASLNGRDYYARACASCHGADGEGTWRGPEIRNPVNGFADWVIRNGRTSWSKFEKNMPKFAGDRLSDQQMSEILTWLRSAPKPYDGKSLYNRFCSNCHGNDGRNGPSGEKISDEDLDEFYEKVREGEGGRRYSKRRDYMPSWSRSELSDSDIRKIADWIRH